MNRLRLQLVVDTLNTIPDNKFNLNMWESTIPGEPTPQNPDCGTVCCAVGWAASVNEELKRQGLYLKKSPNTNYLIPHFEDLKDWDAVEVFFDLTKEEAEYLFFASCYSDKSRLAVIARIQKFMETGEIQFDDDDANYITAECAAWEE